MKTKTTYRAPAAGPTKAARPVIRRPGLSLSNAFTIPFVLTLVLLLTHSTSAQYGTANHLITVRVNPISLLQVVGGGINLNISAANAIAGQDAMSVTNSATQLRWGTNSSAQKITIRTNLAAPLYTLKAEALAPTQGFSLGEVSLSSVAVDLLLNIGRSSGSSTVRYTGIALASTGIGSDAHTITFTIAAQ